jgi:hypothetical protein
LARRLICQLQAFFPQMGQRFFDVVDLQADVVDALSPFPQELGFATVTRDGLHQFDLTFPGVKKGYSRFQVGPLLDFHQAEPQGLLIGYQCFFDVPDDDANVVDSLDQAYLLDAVLRDYYGTG